MDYLPLEYEFKLGSARLCWEPPLLARFALNDVPPSARERENVRRGKRRENGRGVWFGWRKEEKMGESRRGFVIGERLGEGEREGNERVR